MSEEVAPEQPPASMLGSETPVAQEAPRRATAPVRFTYRNWRGEVSERRVLPIKVYWGSTDWHPEPRWLLYAYDLVREAARTFALDDVIFWDEPHALAAYLSALAEQAQEEASQTTLDAARASVILAERQRCLCHLGGLIRTPGGLVLPAQVLHVLELIRQGA